MEHKLLSFLKEFQMLSPGNHVICAVSGGADSMALLWCFYLLQQKLKITLSAAHFNHKLRGAESDRDEAFVRAFCTGHGIPFYAGSAKIKSGAKGLEAAARDARYQFLLSLNQHAKIATAHTADDNAETELLHLIRGTSLSGLGGIPPMRGRIIRPMLQITRQEVLAFLEQEHIPHVEDSSNASEDFLRNRVRHKIMPLFCQENPKIATQLSGCALRLREDETLLSELAHQAFAKAALPDGALSCTVLLEQPASLRSRIIRLALTQWGLPEPEASHVSAVEKLLYASSPSAKAQLPGGLCVARRYDAIALQKVTAALDRYILPCPGTLLMSDFEITCEIKNLPKNFQNTPFHFALDCDTISNNPLIVRSRQPGDSIALYGGTKSLKKLFIDRKIPARLRGRIPVITCNGEVLAVAGIGADVTKLVSSGLAVVFQICKKNHP